MCFFIFILQTGRQGTDYQIKYSVISQKMSQKSIIKFFSLFYLRFFNSYSKVKTGVECDNMIKVNRENNEMIWKKMDGYDHFEKLF